MSWVDLIQKQVAGAFEILDDLRTEVTYIEESSAEYSPATGSVGTSVTYSVQNCIVTTYSVRDVNGTTVQINDRKVIMEASNLSFTPTSHGKLLFNGSTYSIVNVRRDPAGATFILQARQ